MQTVAPYLPWLVNLGALLLVVGLLIRLSAKTSRVKLRGNTVMRYGVLTVLIALALYALLWFMEAWESGVIDAWLDSWQ